MTDTPPGAIQLDVQKLFQMIGELYAENYMRKLNANQGVSGVEAGDGRQSTSPQNLAVYDGKMSEEISRQSRQR